MKQSNSTTNTVKTESQIKVYDKIQPLLYRKRKTILLAKLKATKRNKVNLKVNFTLYTGYSELTYKKIITQLMLHSGSVSQ